MYVFAVDLARYKRWNQQVSARQLADYREVNTVKITHAGEQLPAVSISKAG